MLCPRCGVFFGDPCSACRTYSRIGFVLQTGRLRREDEASVLVALRSAAGALTDLAEEGPRKNPLTEVPTPVAPLPFEFHERASGAGQPGAGSTEQKEEGREEKEGGIAAEKEVKSPEERPEGEKLKKKKKKDKDKDKKGKAEEDEKPREGIEEGDPVGAKEEDKKQSQEELDRLRLEKSQPLEEREEKKEKDDKSLSEIATEHAEANPESYGLGSKREPRGSLKKLYENRAEGSRKASKPPEPSGPPPGHHGHQRKEKGKKRERSRSRRRGTKGRYHGQRGRDYTGGTSKIRGVATGRPNGAQKSNSERESQSQSKGKRRRPSPEGRRRGRSEKAGRSQVGKDETTRCTDGPSGARQVEELRGSGCLGDGWKGPGRGPVLRGGERGVLPRQLQGSRKNPRGEFRAPSHLPEGRSGRDHKRWPPTASLGKDPEGVQTSFVRPRLQWRDGGRGFDPREADPQDEIGQSRGCLDQQSGGHRAATTRRRAGDAEEAREREREETKEADLAKEDKKGKKDKSPEGKAKKKKKKKKEKKKKEGSDDEDSVEKGYKPKSAVTKEAKDLYGGTGMDPKEKIRARVTKRARKHLKRKGGKDRTSSSTEGSSSSSGNQEEKEGETLFGEESKVRILAQQFSGALTCQALQQMRACLIQEAGLEDQGDRLQAVATSYFRQNLAKKCSGPTSRELQTLTSLVDHLVKCRPATASDLAIQRIKAIEQGLSGVHWTVAQRLEVLPQEHQTLTALTEASSAQKEVYNEARMRWASGYPDGRGPRQDNQGRGKQGQKGQNKGGGKDRRDGKGQGNKGDGKKKDAPGGATSWAVSAWVERVRERMLLITRKRREERRLLWESVKPTELKGVIWKGARIEPLPHLQRCGFR